MNLITIENTELTVLEYQGRRIVTKSMVGQVSQRLDGTVRRNSNDQRDKFREGEKRLWEMYVANELPVKDSWDGEFRYTQHVTEEEV